MIGRGVLGNPWLIKECVEYLEKGKIPVEVSDKEKINMMREHYNLLKNDKNEKVATMEMRTHILYYLKGMPNSKEMKNKVCLTKNSEELLEVLDEYEKGIEL